MKKNLLKSLLLTLMVLVGGSAWADDWNTVWTTDFSSAPQGMTYSVSNGSVDISTGVLFYHQGGGSGNRAINTAFTDAAFNVDTNWQMEFDWGGSSANTNASNVAFATNSGTAFTITWEKYATTVTIKDANSTELTSTLPIDGYNKTTMTNLSHFVITGDTEKGIYLTVTNGETKYVDNALVSSTFGYPATFNGALGRAASHMALDNIVFKTPAVAGFVAAPTATLTGVNGASRIFTLASLTAGATIKWSETAPVNEEDYSSWTVYDGSATTAVDPIYAVATDGTYFSQVSTIETGAGAAVTLNAPVISVTGVEASEDFYTPILTATVDESNVLLSPTATIAATFNGTEITFPFIPTEDGTLIVTATADGYQSASAELTIKAKYVQSWVSTDYSTLTDENATTILGENWAKIEGTGRWSSWKSDKEPYTYYQVTSDGVINVKVEENLQVRSVVQLNMGYGLSRNVSGGEAVNFLNTENGTIAVVKYYTGYGAEVSESNTSLAYLLNKGNGMPTFSCNNAKVLMQVTYYNPYVPPFDPSTAIVNADFASLEGWTAVVSESFHDQGNGLIGEYKVRSEFDAATVDETHLATEYCIGVEARWASSFASYSQETAELPAGEYMLIFDVENVNGGTTKATYENRFTVTVGETVSTDTFTEWMDGKSAWTTHGIKFALTEAGKATISLGYGTGENNYPVANTPALFISHLSLVTAEEGDSILKAIADAKAAAEKAKNEAELANNIEKLQGSSYANPSADLLVNGSFDTANEGWSLSNMGYQANQERPTRYVEKWQPDALTGSGSTTQTVKNLPAGAYLLKGTAHTNKDEETAGAKISVNDSVVAVSGTWKEYEILYNLSEAGDITVSFSFNNIASNWVAIDEFSLVYGGDYGQYIADKNKPTVDSTDYTEYIVNADLTGTDGWNTEGTKGYHSVGGVVTVASAAAFDFKQTIANLPAGKYKVTAQAAYRYGNDEQAEYDAITSSNTITKLVQLYATVDEKTVDQPVLNRWEGASETNLYNGEGGVSVVNEKYVPNSTAAVKAWFNAGKYVNELEFNVPADGAVTIGINRISTPASDFTVIGPWTLTRLGDAEAEPEPEPEPQPGQDMTKYITNPSFETGNTNGWTYETSNDHGAKRNDNSTYTMTNCDGDYLFNIWSSGNAISQKVENLPNGTYLMKAVIATDANQQVQLNANGKSIKIDAVGKETGVEGELEFDVLNNTATIGAEGVNKYWYKVDNFRLTYVKGFDIAALKDIYKTALAEAQAITGNMSAEAKLALTAAIAVEVDTTDASSLITAANTLTEAAATANASVAAYAKAKAAIDAAKAEMAATNVYTTEALEAYKAVYDAAEPKYQDGSLTDDEAKALENPTTLTGWHDATIVDNFLLSAWDTNPDFQDAPYYINTWSTEGNNDGSNFKVPFFEYWTGDANALGAKTLTATMSNLPEGAYDVTAWVRVRIKNGAEAPATGITLQANDGEAVNVAAGDQVGTSQMYLKEFTATGSVAEDGVLKIKFNVAADNNISWLSFKNVKFEKKPFKPEAIEGALYSWESPEGLPGEYGGKISYENGEGNRLNYQNSGYYTICLNGKKANMNDATPSANAGYMLVTLDEALSEGDAINITAYINKNESGKKASAYILFDNGANVESPVYSDEANIDPMFNGVPTETTIIVTEAMAGAKSFKMTRGQTGTNLFITKFVIMKKKVEPAELAQTLNVERYAGLGYTAQEATVDFTEAKTFLGVEAITTDMLRIVNPDGTQISDYATYDGWFNGEGAAETWGTTTKVCVKFFQAIPEGKFEICDMNGADSIGATYTVKWALVANDKQVTYTINVKFVEKPVVDLKFADLSVMDTKTVALTSELGKCYEGLTADVDVAAILTKLGVTSLNDVTIYAVQSDGSLDDNYKLGTTDGWRDSTGNWQTWGDNAYFFVKADFTKESAQIYEAGGMDGKNTTAQWQSPATYTATYAFVKTGTADAVVLKVTLTYTVPTGIINIARDGQKSVIYNINGQKVNKAQKGLFIINGKKVVNK